MRMVACAEEIKERSMRACARSISGHQQTFCESLREELQRRRQQISSPRSSQRPRRYRCRTRTCASRHARKDTAAKRPERFSLSQTRAAGRWKDHAPRALAIDAFQPRRSPLSRFSAAERRSREHGSDHTDVCHHDDTLATLLLATNLLQPPSAAKGAQILQLAAGQWVSASAAVTRWVLAGF